MVELQGSVVVLFFRNVRRGRCLWGVLSLYGDAAVSLIGPSLLRCNNEGTSLEEDSLYMALQDTGTISHKLLT